MRNPIQRFLASFLLVFCLFTVAPSKSDAHFLDEFGDNTCIGGINLFNMISIGVGAAIDTVIGGGNPLLAAFDTAAIFEGFSLQDELTSELNSALLTEYRFRNGNYESFQLTFCQTMRPYYEGVPANKYRMHFYFNPIVFYAPGYGPIRAASAEGKSISFLRNIFPGEWTQTIFKSVKAAAMGCDAGSVAAQTASDNWSTQKLFHVDLDVNYRGMATGTSPCQYAHKSWFRAKPAGDAICIELLAGFSWTAMGCKYAPPPKAVPWRVECFLDTSCADRAQQYSMSMFPITGTLVQCVRETLRGIFSGDNECPEPRNNIFQNLQNGMRTAISAALALYIIFFGIKIILGGNVPKRGEIFMFIMKFALVVYFTLGNGIEDFLFDAFVGATDGLQKIVSTAHDAGDGPDRAQGICEYESGLYPEEFRYLATWDGVDCRMAYYFGIATQMMASAAVTAGAGTLVLGPVVPALLMMILPAMLMFQIIFVIVALLLALFTLSIIVHVVHSFILALLCLSIVMFFAPIFIPLSLFKVTKGHFDGWLNLVVGFTLQPMVLFTFLSLMFAVFDAIFFDSCTFERWPTYGSTSNNVQSLRVLNCYTDTSDRCISLTSTPAQPGGNYHLIRRVSLYHDLTSSGLAGVTDGSNYLFDYRSGLIYDIRSQQELDAQGSNVQHAIPFFRVVLPEHDPARQKCMNSMGYKLSLISEDDFKDLNLLFFKITIWANPVEMWHMIPNLLIILLFVFLFYYFVDMLSGIVGDLTGVASVSKMAVGPTELFDKGINKAMQQIKGKSKKEDKDEEKEDKDKDDEDDDSPLEDDGDGGGGGSGGGGAAGAAA